MKDIQVKEIMSRGVITIQEGDRLSKIEEIWKSNPIHHLVVLKGDRVVGVVSKIDMLKAYNGLNGGNSSQVLSTLTAGDIMTGNPLTVEPDDTIGLVADIMLANKFHSIPVVEDGDLAGIVTSHDLIKYGYR
ncbi:MAG: CBS domain-containing protein [Saprospiraceae bacterium]|nr:CBS domain-containing protein [Saprospiraceae bacterium]